MAATESALVRRTGSFAYVSISTGPESLPIEVSVVAKLPRGTGKSVVEDGLNQQEKHPEFLDEYNEPSAIIGKTAFAKDDPTAVYTFGVDVRDLVFHRHAGHRAITGITGDCGCLLKFSLCTPEEAALAPQKFLDKLYIVHIPADRMFVLRFSGTIYHQFCPAKPNETAFFAVSIHTNEAAGLQGDLLRTVLADKSNIPLLTEPAPPEVRQLLEEPDAFKNALHILVDIE